MVARTENSRVSRLTWAGWAGATARHYWPVLLAFSLPFGVYLMTLAPTVFRFDSAEFSTAAYRLGIPHATGYPLYLLLGKLFTFLPVGDVGYRLNLMSAVFAAGTVTVLYQILVTMTRRITVSLATSLLFGFSYYFWSSAVIAEVYTLHTLLTGLILLMLLKWDESRDIRLMYAAAGIWGLSFGNHMSTVLLGPAFGYMLLLAIKDRSFSWRDILPLVTFFSLGLLIYAYLPLRYLAEGIPNLAAQYNSDGELVKVDLTSLGGMWWVISGQMFQDLIFAYDLPGAFVELSHYFRWLLENFLGIGLVFGIVGLVHSAIAKRRQFVLFFLVFAANVVFYVNYGVVDKDTMFLPTYLVWSIWIAQGFVYFLQTIRNYGPQEPLRPFQVRFRALARVPWELALLLIPLVALGINFSYADVSSDRVFKERYSAFLMSVEHDALVLGWWGESSAMTYLQKVEGMRPDVQIIDRWFISMENESKLLDKARHERPIYIFGHLPALSHSYDVVPFWQSQKIVRAPPAVP